MTEAARLLLGDEDAHPGLPYPAGYGPTVHDLPAAATNSAFMQI